MRHRFCVFSVLILAGVFDSLYLVCGADCGEMMFDQGMILIILLTNQANKLREDGKASGAFAFCSVLISFLFYFIHFI